MFVPFNKDVQIITCLGIVWVMYLEVETEDTPWQMPVSQAVQDDHHLILVVQHVKDGGQRLHVGCRQIVHCGCVSQNS